MEQGLCSLGDHVADPTTGRRTGQAERHANIIEYLDLAEPLETLPEAVARAYGAVDEVAMPGAQVRRDIAWRALKRG